MAKRTVQTIAIAVLCTGALLFAGCQNATGAASNTNDSSPAGTDEEVLEGFLADFEQIAAVPRPSHHEEKIGAFLLQWAKDQGFDAYQDETGNVIFDVPATKGCENAPLTVLQAHMDMVAVSSDPDFDPVNTPITTVRTDETLTADGTSLGADDGAGIATIMYYTTSSAVHGPLRAIITVNEEDGMTGINGLDASAVSDATYLINLDGETLGEAIVSTASTEATDVSQEPRRTAPTLDTAVTIKLDGMLGGHSGLMIGEGRINAIQAMGILLLHLKDEGFAYEVSSIAGGTAANAIPSSATALLTVNSQDASRISECVNEHVAELAKAYEATDAGVTVSTEETDLPGSVFEAEQAANIVDFIALVIDGPQTMSHSVDNLVESSSNIGVLSANETEVVAKVRARSSQEALGDNIALCQKRLAELCGFTVEQHESSAAWPIDTDSELQPLMQEVYRENTGEELKLVCLHAGLECGRFAQLNENLDMISIGPEIHDVHSTDETLYLDSIVPFFRLLEGSLERISEQA